MLTGSLQKLDTINEVENWKSTIDPNTGRTYWYHRKTRESSWVKPSCLEALEKLTSDIQQNNSNELIGESFISADENNDESVNFGEVHMDGEVPGYEGGDGDGYDLLLQMLNKLDFSLTPESIVNDLSSKLFATKLKALHNMYACCDETTAAVWIMFPDCLAAICDIMMLPSSLSASPKHTKVNAANHIQCGRVAACVFSQVCSTGSTWDYLFAHASQWLLTPTAFEQITDVTIGFMIAYSFSFLAESNSIISLLISENELLECISQWLVKNAFGIADSSGRLVETIDLNIINQVPCFDSKSLLSLYHISSQSGVLLPLYTVLGYCNACVNRCVQANMYSTLQNEQHRQYLHGLIRSGAVNILLQLVMNTTILIDANSRALAKAIVAQLMAFSPTVGTDILDNYCALSKQMQNIPACTVDAEALSAAAQLDMQDERYYDMLVKEYQQTLVPTPVHRDVEWKPSGEGRAYRLCSAVLWSRCPSLRAILADFWEETDGSGGLELSLDASEEVLACVCEYVHTNILLMPPLLYPDQLDVIRVAQQLNMSGLIHDAIEFVAQGSLAANRELVEQYARSNKLMGLVARCEDCAQGLVEDHIVVELRVDNKEGVKETRKSVESAATNTESGTEVCIDLEAEIGRPAGKTIPNINKHTVGNAKTGKSGEIYRLLLQQGEADGEGAVENTGEIDLSAFTSGGADTGIAPASGENAPNSKQNQGKGSATGGGAVRTGVQGRVPGAQAGAKPPGGANIGDNVFAVGNKAKSTIAGLKGMESAARAKPSVGTGPDSGAGSEDVTRYSVSGRPLKVHPMMEKRVQDAQAQRSLAQAQTQGQPQRTQLHNPKPSGGRGQVGVKELNLDDIENELMEMDGFEQGLLAGKGKRPGVGILAHEKGGEEFEEDFDDFERQQLHDLSVSVDPSIVVEYDESMSLKTLPPPEKKLTPAARRLAKNTATATASVNSSVNSSASASASASASVSASTVIPGSKGGGDRGGGGHSEATTKSTAKPVKRSKYSASGQVIVPTKPSAATVGAGDDLSDRPAWTDVDPDASAVFIPEDDIGDIGAGRDQHLPSTRMASSPVLPTERPPQRPVPQPAAAERMGDPNGPMSDSSPTPDANIRSNGPMSDSSPTPDANIRSSLTLLKKRVTRRSSVAPPTTGATSAVEADTGSGNVNGSGSTAERDTNRPVARSHSNSKTDDGNGRDKGSDSGNTTKCLRNQSCRCPSCLGALQSSEAIRVNIAQPSHRGAFDSDSEHEGGGDGCGGGSGDRFHDNDTSMSLDVDGALPDEDPNYVAPSEQCPQCSRKFTPAAYSRHAKICAKVFMQKRRAFDASEKRKIEDENAVPAYGKKKTAAAAAKKKASKVGGGAGGIPKWKLQSLQFRQAMKAANGGGGDGGGGFMSDPESDQINQQLAQMASDSLIPCPHCNRRFNEKAAERHIPKCQSIKAKPSFLSKNSNTGIGSTPNRNSAAGNNSRMAQKSSGSGSGSGSGGGGGGGAKYKIGSSNESSFGGNSAAAPNLNYKNRYDGGW